MEANEILRYSAITVLSVIVLQFFKVVKGNGKAWFVIVFALSIVGYLLLEGQKEFHSISLKVLLIAPFLLPVSFWFLSKAIFDDHFKMNTMFILLIPIVLVVYYTSFYLFAASESSSVSTLALFVPKIISFGFMSLGVWEALRNKKFDLIDSRLRFRNIFFIITASVIATTLVVESLSIRLSMPEILPVIQKGVIVLISLYFLQSNFELNFRFFLKPVGKKEKVESDFDLYAPIIDKINSLMEEGKVWNNEGLTIGLLADMTKEQEYRVRRAINGQMGFKNFNDFLNHYRVQEARKILQDSTKNNLTILEVAYSLGYQSISPFNKAFKEETGFTPTEFRREKL